MDVLQVIKDSHAKLRQSLGRYHDEKSSSKKGDLAKSALRLASVNLVVKKDFFYPEVSSVVQPAALLVDAGVGFVQVAERLLGGLFKTTLKPGTTQYNKRFLDFCEALERLLQHDEQHVLPRVRECMRTEEREDLGEVLLDAFDDPTLQQEELQSNLKATRKRA